MKAILKAAAAPGAELSTIDRPRVGRDELLIKVYRASICGSDLPIYQWNSWAPGRIKTPMVFGHEFCGEVVEIGSAVRGFSKGDFISVESHIYCDQCVPCHNNQRNVCQNLKTIGIDGPGGFAEFARVPARCAWKHVDKSLKDIGSVLEPLGNAVYATLVEEVTGKSVLVLGCGPQGLFAIQVAKASGAHPVIAVESSPFRRNLARKMGADCVLEPGDPRLMDKIKNACSDRTGVDVVLEMSGSPQAIHLGLQCLRNGGRFTAFGIPAGAVSVRWSDDVLFKGIRIYGIMGREIFRTWHIMDRLLKSGAIDIRPAITHVYLMKDFKKAFEMMVSPDKKCGKIVLQIA